MFANGRSQLLFDRLETCLKRFVSTASFHEFASQFGLYFFYTPKTPTTSGKPGRQRQCLFQWPAIAIVASGTGRRSWAPSNSVNLYDSDGGVRVCVCARTCVHLCARVYACLRACGMCLQYTIMIFDPR